MNLPFKEYFRATNKREKEEKALITFLKRTKEGEYVKIDERFIVYPRVKEQREPYRIIMKKNIIIVLDSVVVLFKTFNS